MKLLLTPGKLTNNFGSPSILSALKVLWRKNNKNLSITTISSDSSKKAVKLRKLYGINNVDFSELYNPKKFFEVIIKILSFRITKKIPGKNKLSKELKQFLKYDALVDKRGICFRDDQIGNHNFFKNVLIFLFFQKRMWLYSKLLGIPVIKYTTSIGPAEKLLTKLTIKKNLGFLCDLILVREDKSYNVLKRSNVKKKTILVPDSAFFMPIKESKKSLKLSEEKKEKTLIGISVSHKLTKFKKNSTIAIIQLINKISDKMNAKILLIPNQINKNNRKKCDMYLAEKIFRELNSSSDIEIINVESFTPNQIKGIISKCDVMIAARYHSIIASLSSEVPVLSLSWHHKYRGVMKLFNIEEYVVEKEITSKKLIESFFDFYENKEKIKQQIHNNLPTVKRKVNQGAVDFLNFITD